MPDFSSGYSFRFVRNVLAKTLVLLLAANLLFALINPMPSLGKLTLYNWLFLGGNACRSEKTRVRLTT